MTCQPKLPPAYRLVALDTVSSTNTEAKRLAVEENAEDGTLVWARQQTVGRGRRGRPWVSPEGNMYSSLVLRVGRPAAEIMQLGYVAALAVYDAIGSIAQPGIEACCKWPNDVLLSDKKVSGILLECESGGGQIPDWLIVGVGINVASHPEDTEYPATSLRAEGCSNLTEVDMLEAYCRHFLTWFNRWQDDGFAPVRRVWLQRIKGIGEPIQVRMEKETLTGTFADLDESGALILDQDGVKRLITAGDIFAAVP